MSIDLTLRQLVDIENGMVSRAIFSDQAIFDKEMEMVFGKSWLFVGHETQIPNRGDYFLSQAGPESVVVTRDSSGQINVLLNSCTHRGMPVCRYDKGNAKKFTCPYHGWTFANTGELTGVPRDKELYQGKLDRSAWGLMTARVARFYGSIWATFDESLPPFEDWLGDMAWMLREFLMSPDGEDDGLEVIDGITKFEIPSNWKFSAENHAGDLYHNISHNSVQRVGLSPTGLPGRHIWDADKSTKKILNIAYPAGGHCVRAALYADPQREYHSQWTQIPEADAYFRAAHYARQKRLGDKARFLNSGGVVFPNFAYIAAGRTAMNAWVPRGPNRTEVWKWMFVPKNAPQVVKDTMRSYLLRYAGPSGLVEQDDIENWSSAQTGAASRLSHRQPYNFQLHMGHAQWGWPEPWLGASALVDEGVSEHSQRIFYDHWARQMTGETFARNEEAVR